MYICVNELDSHDLFGAKPLRESTLTVNDLDT